MYHQKRPRTDGTAGGPGAGQSEGDWTCPSCGNVNFAFRSSCNMRKCGAPKPQGASLGPGSGLGPPGAEPMQASGPGVGLPPALPQTLGGMGALGGMGLGSHYPSAHSPAYIPAPQPIPITLQGNTLVYDPQQMQPPPPQHLSYLPSPSGAYGMAPNQAPMDPFLQRQGVMGMGMGMSMLPFGSPMPMAPPLLSSSGIPDGRKRRGGPDHSGAEGGDWVCPSCGNTNFAFRTHCNMRKCGEPKPKAPSLPLHNSFAMPPAFPAFAPHLQYQQQLHGGYAGSKRAQGPPPPDGSWTCKVCGNVNYPFRTHCNRRNCGVKRGATSAEEANGTGEGEEDGSRR